MKTYVRLDQTRTFVERYGIVLTADEYAGLVSNGKAVNLREWVPTSAPVVSESEVVQEAPPAIDKATATQQWSTRQKTDTENVLSELSAEKDSLRTYITDVKAQLDVTNNARAAMTANQRINELERDTRVLLKAVKYLLRSAVRSQL